MKSLIKLPRCLDNVNLFAPTALFTHLINKGANIRPRGQFEYVLFPHYGVIRERWTIARGCAQYEWNSQSTTDITITSHYNGTWANQFVVIQMNRVKASVVANQMGFARSWFAASQNCRFNFSSSFAEFPAVFKWENSWECFGGIT